MGAVRCEKSAARGAWPERADAEGVVAVRWARRSRRAWRRGSIEPDGAGADQVVSALSFVMLHSERPESKRNVSSL
jgi:hypothetical protein